jgi:hypothetical protein
MSLGWSISIASFAVTAAMLRSTPFGRVSIRSLMEPSMDLSGQNPCAQFFSSARKSDGIDCLNARP